MKRILVFLIVVLMITPVYAGGRKMIKKFDEHGLKDLNNQLKKYEKMIQKLQKQGTGTATSKAQQSQDDFVSETVLESAGTQITSVPAVGVARDDGRLELFDESIDEATVINIEPSSYVHETRAKIAVPSSYFLDLRGIYKTTATQQYTADVAILHDVNGNTITLTSLDETNDVSIAGPIAGGRDQAGAFDAPSWIHFFFIYNPVTGDVSSLSSASPTAPTLPAGYTFFVRAGAVWFSDISQLLITYQMGDRATYNTYWPAWDSHATGVEAIDLTRYVPTTAKLVHGHMGLSAGTAAKKMYVSAVAGSTIKVGALCDAQGTGDAAYGVSGAKDFVLPLLTAQTIWWATESTADIYAVGIVGYTDDL